jgi:starch phosphorylase
MPASIFPLEIKPRIPAELIRLDEMANNLVYTWDRAIRSLYRQLDAELWENCGHKPRVFLRQVSQDRLARAITDSAYMEQYRRVCAAFDAYLERKPAPEIAARFAPGNDLVAYFCLEFGFHESFPIYSGGLGILAGDHCKAASDMGLPFVAVGLLYQKGYFTQMIDGAGTQQVSYTRAQPHDLPVAPARTPQGKHLTIAIEFPGRVLKVQVWEASAGHIRLFLLDTNLPENTEADRAITQQLYGGDRETRLQQELVLGIGGVRALRALQLRPSVWHINEGHAAFQLLERCLWRMREGMDFECAMELVAAGTVFTTHTPVPAGHDIFDRQLAATYLGGMAEALGLDFERLYALGASNGSGFNMTALALRGSRFHNGVSRIHGAVAAQMESGIWPQIPPDENPIGYITNGVHLPTFLAREWVSLFDLRFDDWRNQLLNEEYWQRLDQIPDYAYWSIRRGLKQALLQEVCSRVTVQQRRNSGSEGNIERILHQVNQVDKDLLVIGFARRFATYKRAGMLFSNPGRLARILNDPEHPAVILFAGKAHPNDQPGQQLIKLVHDYSMQPEFIGKIILLEGYDLALARHMVSGVDVWMNTPEYPLEASGTSGQKAGLNGAINLSVLDGWWDEGYRGDNGWAISPGGSHMDHEQRQREEANDLYDILEQKVLPGYYQRNGEAFAPQWVAMSRASMKSTIARFNAQRMLMDYVLKLYGPAQSQRRKLEANGAAPACDLARWKHRVAQCWPGVAMELLVQPASSLYVDEKIVLRVRARLNGLTGQDVRLECLLGERHGEQLQVVQTAALQVTAENDETTDFMLELIPEIAGLQHYQLRLYPCNEALSHPFETGLMIWI